MKSENELTISNQIKKRLPFGVVSFYFSFFVLHLKQVEGGAEEYIATIQSKL